MDFKEYSEKAMSTCLPSSFNDIYAINGLTAEVGEINDKIAKWIRKEYIIIRNNHIQFTEKGVQSGINFPLELAKEVGDVLWFVNLLAHRMGYSLNTIAEMNLDKLASRKERGVIDGNGDNR